MSKPDDGGPAFPMLPYIEMNPNGGSCTIAPVPGMSLRDWFAGQIVAGFSTARIAAGTPIPTPTELAEFAYQCAAAMLLERQKGTSDAR